jgi:copper resistance protein C
MLFVSSADSFAHTQVAESSPAAGERLQSAPPEVMVRFGDPRLPAQPLAVQDARLEVVDPCGRRVDGDDSRTTLHDSKVVVSSGGSAAGRYEIHWFATAADGASQSGVIPFTAARGATCARTVRSDPAEDVDHGIDVTRLESKRTRSGASIRVTTAAAVGCRDITGEQTLRLRFDTDADQQPDVDGRFTCRAGRIRLIVGAEGDAQRLRVARRGPRVLAVHLRRHFLVQHVDVYAESAAEGESCGEGVCADRAPDMGALNAY